MSERYTIIAGDTFEELSKLAPNSADAIVTDPPYGIRFMGKAWDGADIERKFVVDNSTEEGRRRTGMAAAAGKYNLSAAANRAFQEWTYEWAVRAMLVLKPGGYLLSFSSTRTYHRMTTGIEDAGFEIRDQLGWMFGSGFPKSANQSGAWEGFGTGLKPAWEPIVLARKPIVGNVAANLAQFGTGVLNIDASRIPFASPEDEAKAKAKNQHAKQSNGARVNHVFGKHDAPREDYNASGRWPTNVLHDGSAEALNVFPDDAQRFFYCPKASRADRDEGLEDFPVVAKASSNGAAAALADNDEYTGGSDNIGFNKVQMVRNHHPTVKPTALMRYLIRLVTPPGGVVLDPFFGSGSTGKAALMEGFRVVGIEREAPYVAIARARCMAVQPALAL